MVDEAAGEQHVADELKHLRLIVLHPKHLRRGKSGGLRTTVLRVYSRRQ
jgi:hypothetical protein